MADGLQICVFDMRRGLVEGQELDKILFFSPSNCPLPSQLSLIGLSEGLITFTRIFSPKSPCELMEAERHTHVFYQCEPDLWMVMVVEKSKDNEELPRQEALRAVLREAHDLFILFYGSIRSLLHAHPAGDVARSCLHALFPDYLSDFLSGKKGGLPSIGDSLSQKGFVQLLLPQPEVLLEALSLKELLKSWFGGQTVRHVLILFQNMMLTSSLSPVDTATLFRYATARMMPSLLSQAPSKRGSSLLDHLAALSPSNSSSNIDSTNPLGYSRLRNLFNNLSTSYQGEVSDPMLAVPDVATVEEQGTKSQVPRPLSQDAWWRGVDGFLDTNAWGTGGGSNEPPVVWLHPSGECMHLCVYQYKSLTILMLVPIHFGPEVITNVKGQLLDQATQKIQKLEKKLSKDWPGINAWHVAGYRYLYCDWDNNVSKFSPAGKVATLSKESLGALNQIRAEIDLETGRIERSTSMRDRELELCVRTKQNTWVMVRSRAGQELYIVLEKASNTLLLACDSVEKFNKRYYDGFFSSD